MTHDLSRLCAGLCVIRLDRHIGPIVSEGGFSEAPIWTYPDDVIDRLLRDDPFFANRPHDERERIVADIARMSRISRIADCNVLCRDYGFYR